MSMKDSFPGLRPPARARSPAVAVCVIAVVGIAYISPAYAYLDPGTGSIILQGLLAGIAAAMAAAGLYWARLKNFFSSLFSSKKLVDSNPEQDPEN